MSAPKIDSHIPDTEKVDAEVNVLGFGGDDLNDRIERAQEDAKRQGEMPVKEALHKYRGAVLWSALMTLTIVMEVSILSRVDFRLMASRHMTMA
jgi:hypothetical protein